MIPLIESLAAIPRASIRALELTQGADRAERVEAVQQMIRYVDATHKMTDRLKTLRPIPLPCVEYGL